MAIGPITPSYYNTSPAYGKPEVDKTQDTLPYDPAQDENTTVTEAQLRAELEASTKKDELLYAMVESSNLLSAKVENASGAAEMETSSSISDKSSELLQRLVAAAGPFEVRQVIADAVSNLVSLKFAAAMSSGSERETADAAIRKLERLISRGNHKIDKLNEEEALHRQQIRAQERKQSERAEEIKAELRKRKIMRKAQENSYLLEEMYENMAANGVSDPNMQLDPATEAQIAAQAEAQAAAEFAAGGGVGGIGGEDTSGIGGGDSAGGDTAEISVAAVEAGGEAAAVE